MSEYSEFLFAKNQNYSGANIPMTSPHSDAFDFQNHLVEWALALGRAAIFADCGLGKTLMQLMWADHVVRHTNKPVLIACPLSVSMQTVMEAEKFGFDVARSNDGSISKKIITTNYERLEKFNPLDFGGIVCDESSILKNFDGKYKALITEFMRQLPYRLLCTATAAPNDFTELGTSSEALGYLGHTDMLTRFFKNDQRSIRPPRAWEKDKSSKILGPGEGQWRFKGHAETPFWQWVCSWARACRRPSDLGFDDDGFILPPLNEQSHLVEAETLPDGMLFALPAVGLDEQRKERRRTVQERCDKVAELVNSHDPSLVWCHLNDEGNILERIIPDAVQVSGSDSDDAKEEKLFGFAKGDIRVLVTKPKIGAFGLNFQQCSHVTFFPTHSFEQYYQGIRRCWRFGQKNPVTVDIVTTEGEKSVLQNLQRKSEAADKMFSRIVGLMNDASGIDTTEKFTEKEDVPKWL